MNQSQSYKKFIYSFIAFFFLFPAALAFFNYQVDPNHRYRFSISEPSLRHFSESGNLVLTLPENYDDRILLKKFIRVIDPPSAVVLGGSRVLNIQPEMLKSSYRESFLNAGIAKGTIRDYIAFWQLIKETGHKPEVVFLGVEQQSLNSVSQNHFYLSVLEYYEAFFQKDLSLRVKFMGVATDFKDLLSLQTTLASFDKIFNKPPEATRLIHRDELEGNQAARTSSFSFLYPPSYASKSLAFLNNQGNQNGRGEVRVFEMWNPSDRRGYNQLAALIQDIKKAGARPIIVGMPYHPEAFRVISENSEARKNLILFVDELKRLAAAENVTFYDGIISSRSSFEAQDFIDGVHLDVQPSYELFFEASSLFGKQFFEESFPRELRQRKA